MLEAIYDIVSREHAVGIMLARLAQRFDCPSGALVYVDVERPAAAVELGHGWFTPTAIARYHAEFAAIDPAPAALAKLRIGEAAATDRIFSEAERDASRFLREFYHPLGLIEALGAPIAAEGGCFGLVGIHRSNARPPFSDNEIADFADLATHIARAMALRGRFFAMAHDVETRDAVLDAAGTALVMLNERGMLDHANSTARSIFSRGDGLVLTREGRLQALDRVANAKIEACLTSDARTPFIITVPLNGDTGAYVVKVGTRIASGLAAGRVIHIADMGRAPTDMHATLAQALGLTRPAARLLASLISGDDLKTHAAKAGVSVETVRYHLKSVFKATGTNRQTDLVRLTVALLRDLGF